MGEKTVITVVDLDVVVAIKATRMCQWLLVKVCFVLLCSISFDSFFVVSKLAMKSRTPY